MIQKVLIAKRGEGALRIIRACRDLGVRTVLAHSDVDRASLPARLADETICIGPAAPAELDPEWPPGSCEVPNVDSA